MTTIPVLTTERLILRPHEPGDLEPFFAMRADPRVIRHLGKTPLTRPQAWLRLCSAAGHWQFMGFGYWAVAERASGAFLGEVGLADFRRDMEPSLEGLAEAGWVLVADAAGKGYATEAMRRAFDWFDATFQGRESVCMIEDGHTASIRVAEKCGFRRWTETTYMDDPVILFRRAGAGTDSKLQEVTPPPVSP